MNLVRLGHYHVPTGREDAGYCQTALVVGIPSPDTVNLYVWTSEGHEATRLDVAVSAPDETKATFHLSGDCPWHR